MFDQYGWSDTLHQSFQDYAALGLVPGRVIVQQRGNYRIVTRQGELTAEISGKFAREAVEGGYPVTGDWVAAAVRPDEGTATIKGLLPRNSVFVRKAAGTSGGVQVVAANVDIALLAASLNGDLSVRRIERYLAMAWESGARPVIVLTKADLCDNTEELRAQVEAIAFGTAVHVVSAVDGSGLDELSRAIKPGETAVLLGSSGVGKSTLVNALAGHAKMATREIREHDARGRHTTTHRELVLLPSGALLLDTPGMRELGLWDSEEGVAATFADIDALALACHFKDCKHEAEPGCAVQAAIESGSLDEGRLRSFRKLHRELAHLDRKDNPRLQAEQRKLWIQRHKNYRARVRHREEQT